ncbi:MAG: winged helix-turn-helix transcriptional regulator [Kiritimatiellae bacterium]|nr:winged helix-turn-helix transcriptional regulator [Kiritimatiellia bacterium]
MSDVICPSCGKSYYEITGLYREGMTLHGAMFKAKDNLPVSWYSFETTKATQEGHIECPECGTNYMTNCGIILSDGPAARPQRMPADYNKRILLLAEEGKSATEIAEEVGYSPQAIGRRLYDLRKGSSK